MPQQANLQPVRTTPPDQLRQVLDPLPLGNDFKATIWDSYSSADTPQLFRQRFDKMAIPDDVKARLWDLKFGHTGTAPVPSPTETTGRNLSAQAARHVGTTEAVASTLPLGGAALYGGMASGAGLGLASTAALSGLGAGGGEAVYQMLQHLLQSKGAPQTSGEAATRIGEQAVTQAALEGAAGLAAKPFQWLLRGTTPIKDPYTDLLARVNRQYGLRLTAPELSGGTVAETLQHVANRGLFGQPIASSAIKEGKQAATGLIDSQLGFINPESATSIAVGEGVQNATRTSSKLIHDVLGSNVGAAAEMLKDQPVNTIPFKQWALQEWQKANLVGEALGNSGEEGAARALGFKSPAEAKGKVPPQVWQQVVAATTAAPKAEGEISKPITQILGRPDNTVSGVLKDILKLPDNAPFSVVNKYKQDLFELNPNRPTAFQDKAVGLAKAANAKLTGAMEDAVKGTPAGDAWIRARGEYAKAAQLFEPGENAPYTGKFIQSVLSAKPEDVVGLIKSESDVNSLRAAVTDYAKLGNVQQIQQASDVYRSVQRKYVEGLVKGDGTPNAIYSLKTRLNDNPAAQALFKNDPEIYNNLRLIADATARVQKLGSVNVLGQTTAQHVVARLGVAGTLGMLGGGVGYAESGGQLGPALATALAFELVPYGISKVIYSRPLTELMIRGLGGMAAESHIVGLSAVGKGAVKASPYLGTGAADVIRAIQLADRLNQGGGQSTPVSPAPVGQPPQQ